MFSTQLYCTSRLLPKFLPREFCSVVKTFRRNVQTLTSVYFANHRHLNNFTSTCKHETYMWNHAYCKTNCDIGTKFYRPYSDFNDKRKLHRFGSLQDDKLIRSKRLHDAKRKVRKRVEEIIQKENILTIPNVLCLTRIVLSPVLAYLVVEQHFELAAGLFVYAGITDLLDGFIARNFKNQQSVFGSFLDPLADKLLVMSLFLSLTWTELIPLPLTALIIARDVCLVGSAFYIRYLSLPEPKTLARYFDATYATAKLSPTGLSKVNTAIQLMLVGFTLASPIFHYVDHIFLHGLWYITATTTFVSGLSYIFNKNTFKLFQEAKHKK